ncbi:MAG TPA: YigZ family protein [Cyclobacteriaceae bacterium]
MVFSYRTIEGSSEGSYKEKGSKFFGFAYPVQSEDEVKLRINELKKKYFDARHHCFAYVLGPDKKRFRAFDDGEPNHSAGDPILGQIRSKELTNILIVVVRYFGGVKLGVGGLISAYKQAAEEALRTAIMLEKEVQQQFILEYDYNYTPEVMKLVKEFELEITNQYFEEKCKMNVTIPLRMADSFEEKTKLLNALGKNILYHKILLS